MIIKKLQIENIRSYVSETIEFPKGSVLLAGDIGSGKSTILLSIEFALFGIMKGDINANQLLRHGAKEGFVELTLEINSKEIIIKRGLKRASAGIQQDAGYIIIDGRKSDLVAKELKARILSLLGYSELLLNKSKSLIYRYTVYTPQEDMKKIILQAPEERINTLRSVFGIDKYRTIRENATNFSRELKRKISYSEGQIQDLSELKDKYLEKIKQSEELLENIEKINPIVKKAKDEIKKISDEVAKKENEVEAVRQTKNSLKLTESRIENNKKNILLYEERMAFESKRIKQLETEIEGQRKVSEEKLEKKIFELKNEITKERNKIIEITKFIGQHEYKKSESQKVIQKISSLTKCPTCMQEVDKEHKCRILEEAKKNIEKTEEKLCEILKEKENSSKISAASEQKLLEYESIQKKHEIVKIKTKTLDEKKADVEKIKNNIEELKKIEKELNEKKATLEENLKNTKDAEESFLKLRQELLRLQAGGKDEEIKLARIIEQKNLCIEIITGIKRQIDVKEELKQKINRMKKTHNWLTDFFENLIISMEKHVFLSIYYEFNSLVSKWFEMLIGDETITLRLDNDFTPIMEQNGYETEVENLSGGEKTAVALSYRLALNKVINDLISNINTKDIIILDEPTDGFSSEQLDRVKEVIEELSLSQVIIVSHEQKVEGFVENIIRIEKQRHESRVV